jgi:PhnB protein
MWAMRNPPPGYQTVSPYLLYEDAPRVIEHLKVAFGFVERLSQAGGADRTHTELVLGDDGLVMIGQAWDGFSSPRSLGAHPPSLIHVYVSDVDALHERAKNAGAEVTELEMSPVGDRRFTATDPEGQVWVFAQRVADPAS